MKSAHVSKTAILAVALLGLAVAIVSALVASRAAHDTGNCVEGACVHCA